MDNAELKRKMMGLWKDTFHDSDTYIRLIFDTYFDPEWVEYEESGSDIISGLLGIPYIFGGTEENTIRGLYLCGLATKNRFRGHGLMTGMLERINRRAADAGFAFTFLIPATNHLHGWYARRGYVDAFYRCPLNYTAVHDFQLEKDTILDQQKGKVAELKRRYYDTLTCDKLDETTPPEIIERIGDLIRGEEKLQQDLELVHSDRDIVAILEESIISNEPTYYVHTHDGIVTAIGFVRNGNQSRMDIKRIYCTDLSSRYKLLDHIKRCHPEHALCVYIAPRESERRNLAESYAMARILNLYEILKFQAKGHGDLKYSILVKEPEGGVAHTIQYDIKGGKVNRHEADDDRRGLSDDRLLTEISYHDMSNVLFRRPDTGILISEAFGMPSLGGYISLMLD